MKTKHCYNPNCKGNGIFEDETGTHCPICETKFNTNFYHVDGSGFNGIHSRYCIYDSVTGVYAETGSKKNFTNNESEYIALIACLRVCNPYSIIESDSQLIVNQFNGKFRINYDNLKHLNIQARALNIKKNCEIRWIPRHKNMAGKRLDKTK